MVCILVSLLIGFDVTLIMVLGTALWAAIDSSRMQLKKYKSGIPDSPLVLFAACALLWIIGFPWYLSVRYKIKTGTAVLKPGIAEPGAAPNDGPATSAGNLEDSGGPSSVS